MEKPVLKVGTCLFLAIFIIGPSLQVKAYSLFPIEGGGIYNVKNGDSRSYNVTKYNISKNFPPFIYDLGTGYVISGVNVNTTYVITINNHNSTAVKSSEEIINSDQKISWLNMSSMASFNNFIFTVYSNTSELESYYRNYISFDNSYYYLTFSGQGSVGGFGTFNEYQNISISLKTGWLHYYKTYWTNSTGYTVLNYEIGMLPVRNSSTIETGLTTNYLQSPIFILGSLIFAVIVITIGAVTYIQFRKKILKEKHKDIPNNADEALKRIEQIIEENK